MEELENIALAQFLRVVAVFIGVFNHKDLGGVFNFLPFSVPLFPSNLPQDCFRASISGPLKIVYGSAATHSVLVPDRSGSPSVPCLTPIPFHACYTTPVLLLSPSSGNEWPTSVIHILHIQLQLPMYFDSAGMPPPAKVRDHLP